MALEEIPEDKLPRALRHATPEQLEAIRRRAKIEVPEVVARARKEYREMMSKPVYGMAWKSGLRYRT